VLGVATRLGLTSFGGPVAHIGYFRDEYVVRRRWLDEETFADFVALSHLLPGPSSSQVGIAIGAHRAGRLGALAAWVGFTLPSAVALVLFAYAVADVATADAGWLHGLEVVAVAVVARAVFQMARVLAPDLPRAAIALAAAGVSLAWAGALGQVTPIAAAAAIGAVAFRGAVPRVGRPHVPVGRRLAVASLALFAGLLVALPVLRGLSESHALAVVDSFYRTGSLVFGGGHVVLPLLHAEVVQPGWVSDADFVAGYGAAQAVPGPLFTFAGYLGAVMQPEPDGIPGAALALGAIFLPSFLLVAGTLPLLALVRARPRFAGALEGVNAAVVGLLLAALYDPIWTSAIDAPSDVALAVALLALLALRVPPWAVVPIAAGAGALLA
jgi:chromate transporter